MRRSTVNQDPKLTELTCHSRCQLPDHLSYIWYKNGQEVKEDKDKDKVFHPHPINPADRYHCALSSYEHSPSTSVCEFTSLFFTKIMWWKVSTTQLRESLIQFDPLSIFTSSSEKNTFLSEQNLFSIIPLYSHLKPFLFSTQTEEMFSKSTWTQG